MSDNDIRKFSIEIINDDTIGSTYDTIGSSYEIKVTYSPPKWLISKKRTLYAPLLRYFEKDYLWAPEILLNSAKINLYPNTEGIY
ncbi:unnamed protein product [Gordionus sp. m RMFG-2023]